MYLSVKNIAIVQLQQPLIGKIDTKLFKTILNKILKPKNIQNINLTKLMGSSGCQTNINFIENMLE